jgi:tetratricopeptide (TPR) repeat protein
MTDRRTLAQGIAVLLVVGSLLTAAAGLQYAREKAFPPPAINEDWMYVTSGEAARRMTVGYSALAADLYWIRAIQYFGGIRLRLVNPAPGLAGEPAPTGYPLLYPLLDVTTTLDPRFNIAYRFGAVFLGEPFPGGGGRPDLAIALLEKGLRARPDKWEYMQDIGFVHYWWLQDYGSAAKWFDRASQVAGAPWWLKSLAAVTLAEGGDRESSRLMWSAIYESAEIDWLKRDAERRLVQLRALDDIDALQAMVDRLATARGAPSADWTEAIRAGLLKGVPLDPTGLPYVITATGQVQLSATSGLLPLPVEPKSISAVVS